MKLILSAILVSLFFTGFAQFSISDGSEFDIDLPKNISAYEIYYQSASAKRPSLYLKVVAANGLRKKIVEFENGKVKSTRNNFYEDTLLVKTVVQYTNPNSTETFYYKYDSVTHEQIYAKGYKDNKVIYSYSKKHLWDTIIVTETFSDYWNKSNNKTVVFFSPDSLIKTVVEYTDNGISPRYSVIRYAPDHSLQFQIDSSSGHKEYIEYDSKGRVQKRVDSSRYTELPYQFLYTYDSIGRLKNEEIISDTIFKRIVEHYYTDTQQVDVSYIISRDKDKFLTFMETRNFDSKGREIYREEVQYKESSDPIVVNRTKCKTIYNRGRIVKFEKHSDDGYNDIYWVKYFESQ